MYILGGIACAPIVARPTRGSLVLQVSSMARTLLPHATDYFICERLILKIETAR